MSHATIRGHRATAVYEDRAASHRERFKFEHHRSFVPEFMLQDLTIIEQNTRFALSFMLHGQVKFEHHSRCVPSFMLQACTFPTIFDEPTPFAMPEYRLSHRRITPSFSAIGCKRHEHTRDQTTMSTGEQSCLRREGSKKQHETNTIVPDKMNTNLDPSPQNAGKQSTNDHNKSHDLAWDIIVI